VRYWPEECQGKEYGKTKVRNLSESSTADYTLREFLVSREGSAEEERKVYHYHFQVTKHAMFKLFIKDAL
jgi:tyrosine-protein phosphatase non-receptor type 11